MEEERRLAFVGITRARERLILTKAARRTMRGISERTITSPFLGELPAESVEVIDRTSYDFEPARGYGSASGYGSGSSYSTRSASSASYGSHGSSAKRSNNDDNPLPEIQLNKPGLEKFRVGTTVRHPTYGVGKIAQISEIGQSTRAVIVFNRVGQKTFILEAARLEVIG